MKLSLSRSLLFCLCVVLGCVNVFGLDISLTDIGSLDVGYTVSQIEYSPEYGLLFLREEGSSIHVIDVETKTEISNHAATESFTDMDLTGDDKYFFAADYGREVMGSGNPINPHYVHRFDLENRTWKIALAPDIAWKIEAVSGDRVLLQEHDQHVDMTLNSFGDSMKELSRIRADYYGDFEYDSRSHRVYHGSSGSSSREVHVRRVSGDTLVSEGSTGTYGTAQGGGGTSVLSTDGFYFYYGALQIEAMNIRHNIRSMPERIYAASDQIAFGKSKYYYAETGMELGSLGFETTVYGVSENGANMCAFNPGNKHVYLYEIGKSSEKSLFDIKVEGPKAVGYEDTAQFKATALYLDGSEDDVTASCEWSIDRDIFGSIDSEGLMTTVNRPGVIVVSASYTENDRTVSKSMEIECIPNYGKKGVVEIEFFPSEAAVEQIEYAPGPKLLFLRRSSNAILVVDAASREVLDVHQATENFTDMDLTADSKYLFVADYGGERTGYGTPIRPHYVHRYDVENGSWKIAQAPKIAWKIEAVSAERVLLQEHDQHVDMTLNSFGATMSELSRIRADYYGDFEYDPKTKRVYHGCSGSSSREIHVRRVFGDTLINEGNSGTYGTAQSGGGTSILSTNGKYFYYGRLQVDAMNIKTNLHTLDQLIYAASDKIAFGETRYYDAETGEELSGFGFATKVYGVSENGRHLWAYESEGNILHHYIIEGEEINSRPTACIDGENRVVEATDPNGALVLLDGSCSTDADSSEGTNDDIVSFNWYKKVSSGDDVSYTLLAEGSVVTISLPLGEHVLVLEVIDSQGASDQAEVSVIVEDTAAPELAVSVSPSVLWPANNKLVEVTASWNVSDNCDSNPNVSLLTITISEEGRKKELKNNEKDEDIVFGDDGQVFLRATRSGKGDCRVYVLTYQAVDDSANTTVKSVEVKVPHDMGSGERKVRRVKSPEVRDIRTNSKNTTRAKSRVRIRSVNR